MPKNQTDDGVQGDGNQAAARRSTGVGETHLREKSPRRDGDQPHDAKLDHALEETFPASDPVSISPGSD